MKSNWWKAIASFLVVLLTMPLGHALMMIMEKTMTPAALHYSAFFMGFVGLVIVIAGVFVKGDTRQTFFGLIGGLLFWTGWVEFLFQYYATRWGTLPEMENGEVLLWASKLLLMVRYDKTCLGDRHPVTSIIAAGCLLGSVFIFKKQLRLSSWGANIRMAIATVVVFWVPVEVLGQLDFFHEFWVEPEKYATQMICILVVFMVLIGYILLASRKKKA